MRRSRLSALLFVLTAAAISFLMGIQWGLPSRAADPFLFGDRVPWTGETIVSLAPRETADRGADVDANPIADRTQTVTLNDTDAKRAEIVRRYRLFSNQPDEMITFKSLAQIKRNGGDPRLYQYGGLWIYPVGALIKATLNPQASEPYYLDHPELFGRFYVVARAYSAFFGILGAWAVYWIIRRLTGGLLLPVTGGLCFAMLPVVVNLAHEAKPHLAGTSLTLLAVIAAATFVETGRDKWAGIAGALCGAAFGMIVSSLVAFSIPFAMVFMRREDNRHRMRSLAIALTCGILVFAITNPFLIFNAVARPERMRSNLGNSTAMYATGTGGLGNAIGLIIEGASPLVTAVGIAGATFIFGSKLAKKPIASGCLLENSVEGDVGWILAAPAALNVVIFMLLASNKPPEYARFALLFDVALLIAAFAALGRVRNPLPRAIMAVTLVAFTGVCAIPYWAGFIRDCDPVTSRLAAAGELKELADSGAHTLRLSAEPAPYICPPVDLFRYTLLLTPPGKTQPADVIVSLNTARVPNRMSWADVSFVIVSPLEKLREWRSSTTHSARTHSAATDSDAKISEPATKSTTRPDAPAAVSSP